MSETDFDRIADVLLARVYEVRFKGLIAEHDVVVARLREVWNARGAADCAAVESRRMWDSSMTDAIRLLDR